MRNTRLIFLMAQIQLDAFVTGRAAGDADMHSSSRRGRGSGYPCDATWAPLCPTPPHPTPLLPALLPSSLLLLPSQALLSSFTPSLLRPSVGRPVSTTDRPQPRQQDQVARLPPMTAPPLAYPRPAGLADAGPGANSRPSSQELREVFTPV